MPDPGIPTKQDRNPEAGGITILVTLLLLVLLTISALAMSKNALREVIITGTSRQGSQVRNLADTGLEWSIFWLMDDPTGTRPAVAADSGASALRTLKGQLVTSQQTGIMSPAIKDTGAVKDMTLTPDGVNPTQRFELFLTFMGNPPLKYTGAIANASSIAAASPATVQLWSVRSDGYIDYSGGTTFLHKREAWFTVPPTAQP